MANCQIMRVAVFYDADGENLFFDPKNNRTDSVFEIKHMLTQCLQKVNGILNQVGISLLLTNHVSEIRIRGTVNSIEEYACLINSSLAMSNTGLDYMKAVTSFYLIVSGNDIYSTGRIFVDTQTCDENKFTKIVVGIKTYTNELVNPDKIVHDIVIGLFMSAGMGDSCIIPDSFVFPECVPVSAGCWHSPKLNVAHDGDAICGNNVREKGEECDDDDCKDCKFVGTRNRVFFKLIPVVIAAIVIIYKTISISCKPSNGQISEIRHASDSVLLQERHGQRGKDGNDHPTIAGTV